MLVEPSGYGLNVRRIRKLKALGAKTLTVCGLDTDAGACVLGVMFSLFDAETECVARRELCWSSTGLGRDAMSIIEKQFPRPGKVSGVTACRRRVVNSEKEA